MPPPGYEPFLKAICENPDDDTVRLVYADWLDENGDPERAEFIRLQIALHGKPKKSDPQQIREEELIEANGRVWLGELPELPHIHWPGDFSRGFVKTVCVGAGKWFIEHRIKLFGSAPVRHLSVSEAGEGTLAKVLAVREIGCLTGLSLCRCRVPRNGFRILTHSPRLANLRELAISDRSCVGRYVDLTDEEAQEFVKTPFLPALEAIYFGDWISPRAEHILRTRFKIVSSRTRFSRNASRFWYKPTPPLGSPLP